MGLVRACRALILTATASVLLAMPASADLKSFNAAVKAGDFKAAATAAEATWKTWDRADPDTALLAREFGFAALVAGRNDLARQFGKFLVEEGARLATPDDQPLTSAVLYRAADLKLQDGASQRGALRSALRARMAAPGVDMTTVLAWELMYTSDWQAGEWDDAIASGTGAAEFYGRNRTLLARQRKAELHAISSEFVKARGQQTQQRNDLYDRAADMHDRIVADIGAATSSSTKAELWAVKWEAEAWAMAIESFLLSSYQQVGSNISTALKPRPLVQPAYAQHAESSPLPICAGSFEGKRLVYPENRKFRGVGAMVIGLTTAADGKVTNVDVLGVIPDESFISGLVETMETWKYEVADGVDRNSCRVDSRNHVYKATFRIG